jgi:hypothetical protein
MMKVLLIGPINSLSGYGARTRALYADLINLDVIPDLRITNWGNTLNFYDNFPTDTISDEYDYIFYAGMLDETPLFPKGMVYYVTAGIETDKMYNFSLSPGTKILTSSTHSSNLIKVENKVLPESVEIHHEKATRRYENIRRILISGAWIGGSQIGEDRKNIPLSIKTAIEMISQSSDPEIYELWVHTSMGTYSEIERTYIANLISHLNERYKIKIKLFHGILLDDELYDMYSKCQLMLTLTHGEGFGRHLAEFMSTGGKLIAPKFSGYLDYASTSDNYLMDVDVDNVPDAVINKWILKDSKWANVNPNNIMKMFAWFNQLDDDFWNHRSDINIHAIEKNNMKSYKVLEEILYK